MRNSIAIVELMLIQNVVQLTLHLGDELFQMVGKIIVLSILHGLLHLCVVLSTRGIANVSAHIYKISFFIKSFIFLAQTVCIRQGMSLYMYIMYVNYFIFLAQTVCIRQVCLVYHVC